MKLKNQQLTKKQLTKMENFEKFSKMNESKELDLLQNLYTFFQQKYEAEEATEKFTDQVNFLIEQGEVSADAVETFYRENDIEAEIGSPEMWNDIELGGPAPSDYGCGSAPSSPPPSRFGSTSC